MLFLRISFSSLTCLAGGTELLDVFVDSRPLSWYDLPSFLSHLSSPLLSVPMPRGTVYILLIICLILSSLSIMGNCLLV